MKHINETVEQLPEELQGMFLEYVKNAIHSTFVAARLNKQINYLGEAVDIEQLACQSKQMANSIDWLNENRSEYTTFFIQSGGYWSEMALQFGSKIWQYLN